MENRKTVGDSSSSSLDHLFGPKDSSSSSSSGVFGSIFPPPSMVHGRDSAHSGIMGSHYHGGNGKYGSPGNTADYKKGERSGTARSSVYQNETTEPCYFSSSIYYGGQENYSSTKKTTESPQFLKKDGGDDDPNGSNSNSASRGNWWQGSLYY
ncbi:hypothetical protein SLEP1_g5812 [Rubroshorea leprosula]|uniref:Uncharacterized protein n=1 Tax=Rubroshorea leprosula TaxID=152421 RepID=A0AAV5HZ32_9ROSI|nr:hypothetical protein SLEP1_g5812 [Rubroshorea leprosula]